MLDSPSNLLIALKERRNELRAKLIRLEGYQHDMANDAKALKMEIEQTRLGIHWLEVDIEDLKN